MKSNLLGSDELLTEIRLSTLREGTQQKYDEFTIRQSIGFPIVNLASSVSFNSETIEEARIVFGSIFPIPLWAKEAEAFLIGKDLPRNC
jgi:CO/xanthine dehydrogenase FAD-binding subunit